MSPTGGSLSNTALGWAVTQREEDKAALSDNTSGITGVCKSASGDHSKFKWLETDITIPLITPGLRSDRSAPDRTHERDFGEGCSSWTPISPNQSESGHECSASGSFQGTTINKRASGSLSVISSGDADKPKAFYMHIADLFKRAGKPLTVEEVRVYASNKHNRTL